MRKYKTYAKPPIIYDPYASIIDRYALIKKAASIKFIVLPCKICRLVGKPFERWVDGGFDLSVIEFNEIANRYSLSSLSTYKRMEKLTFISYLDADETINVLMRVKR